MLVKKQELCVGLVKDAHSFHAGNCDADFVFVWGSRLIKKYQATPESQEKELDKKTLSIINEIIAISFYCLFCTVFRYH